MNLKIKNFPHAQLDQNTFRGFLCHYYVVGSIDINLWRASYSPEILNFKEGGNNSIEFFVPPFAELIKFVMNQTNLNSGILIPVPSSTSKNDSFFSAVPYDKIKMSKRKNRDNRSEIFCEKVTPSF